VLPWPFAGAVSVWAAAAIVSDTAIGNVKGAAMAAVLVGVTLPACAIAATKPDANVGGAKGAAMAAVLVCATLPACAVAASVCAAESAGSGGLCAFMWRRLRVYCWL